MTSTISFSKLVRAEFRQMSWLAALQAVLFLLLIPFRVLMALSVKELNALDVLCGSMGFARFENAPVVLVMGGACALCGFSYLYSQTKLDLYHSLPVKRDTLFAAKYLASFLTFAVPFGAAQLLGLLTGVLYGAGSVTLSLEVVVCTVQLVLFFLCSYSMTLVAVMLTGKLLTTVLAIGVFGCYLPLLIVLGDYFVHEFLAFCEGTNWLWAQSDRSLLKHTSPWAFCVFWGNGVEVGRVGLTGRWPSLAGLCQLVAVAALLSLLSLVLYRHRKTESAGGALAFRRLEGIIKIMLAVPVSLVTAIIAYITFYDSGLWELVFIALFGTLFCMLMEFIYRWDIRQVLMHKWHIAVSVALALAVFFGFRYDVLGYNSYLPEQDELAAIAVREEYASWDYPTSEGETTRENARLLDYLESDEVGLLYGICEDGAERAKTDGVGNYDENLRQVNVKYCLKSGKEVCRRYEVDVKRYVSGLTELMEQDPSYKERFYPVLGWREADIVEISGTFYSNELEDLDCSDEWCEVIVPAGELGAVLAAYQEDLRSLSFEQIYHSNSYLGFRTRKQAGISYMTDCYPLGNEFKHTIAILKRLAEEQIDEAEKMG